MSSDAATEIHLSQCRSEIVDYQRQYDNLNSQIATLKAQADLAGAQLESLKALEKTLVGSLEP